MKILLKMNDTRILELYIESLGYIDVTITDTTYFIKNDLQWIDVDFTIKDIILTYYLRLDHYKKFKRSLLIKNFIEDGN